jgi:hypothetical protein
VGGGGVGGVVVRELFMSSIDNCSGKVRRAGKLARVCCEV